MKEEVERKAKKEKLIYEKKKPKRIETLIFILIFFVLGALVSD